MQGWDANILRGSQPSIQTCNNTFKSPVEINHWVKAINSVFTSYFIQKLKLQKFAIGVYKTRSWKDTYTDMVVVTETNIYR